MPLVNTSRINKPKYYCTRGTKNDTGLHEQRKQISKAQWDQDGMCDDCASYLWNELVDSLRDDNGTTDIGGRAKS